MLKRTFLHLEKYRTVSAEKELRNKGLSTWEDLLGQSPPDKETSGETPQWYADSMRALEAGDVDWFAERIPEKEHFRLALAFPDESAFVDIETTGLSRHWDQTTIIGWSIGGRYDVVVFGRDDPSRFLADLTRAKALVTFNGKCFDLKFLLKDLGQFAYPKAHADLRFVGRRAGFSGGQKAIEIAIGCQRQDDDVGGGAEAVKLWLEYRRAGAAAKRALRRLIVYNHADVEGMKHIFDACAERLTAAEILPDFPGRPGLFARRAARFDFSDPDNFPFSLDLM
ncbi:MAG: ribonuclease H-like domain-containing protein [Deltaproteobacteria bacterium]|jgi:uncharacterized protein YprB with RNaseH-like and TPR domain|nr:ribonuclease H-like domain-containing protein [Deltaproteobacteria bacterium]